MIDGGVEAGEADHVHLFRSRATGPTAGVDAVFENLSKKAGAFAVSEATASALARCCHERSDHGWAASYERVDAATGVTRAFGPLRRLVLDDADRAALRASLYGRPSGKSRLRDGPVFATSRRRRGRDVEMPSRDGSR